jgi:hypothetical protein
MRIDVLTVSDCPNRPVMTERLESVLAGRTGVAISHVVVDDEAEAVRLGMHGSPTLLIDGVDPFAEPGELASVSCRLYRDADGRASGAPSVDELRRVLAEADCCPPRSVADQVVGRAGRGRLAPVERGWRAVHQAVLRSFVTTGHAPGLAELETHAMPLGVPAAQVLAELAAEDFLTLDAAGQVVAAYPFSAVPTDHVVQIAGGPEVWSMCAIDALGIPVMLGRNAEITSKDAVTGEPIQIDFHGGVATWRPDTAVVYYGAHSTDGPAASVCCGYLRFFTDRAGAQTFAADHPEVTGELLDQAAAERLGAQIFGPLLNE